MSKHIDRLEAMDDAPDVCAAPLIEEYEEYARRLAFLNELEDEAWRMVRDKKISATQAEEAIWRCVEWVEGTPAKNEP